MFFSVLINDFSFFEDFPDERAAFYLFQFRRCVDEHINRSSLKLGIDFFKLLISVEVFTTRRRSISLFRDPVPLEVEPNRIAFSTPNSLKAGVSCVLIFSSSLDSSPIVDTSV